MALDKTESIERRINDASRISLGPGEEHKEWVSPEDDPDLKRVIQGKLAEGNLKMETKYSDMMQVARAQKERTEMGLDTPYIVLPNSRFRIAWDVISLFLLMYVATFSPLQIAFYGKEHRLDKPGDWPVVFAIDRFVDFMFVVDIVINFRSAFVNEDGKLMFEKKEAAQRYVSTWFLWDLVSVLPWDALPVMMGKSSRGELRLPRLLRMFRAMKLLKIVRTSRVIKRMEQVMSLKYGALRLLKFCVSVGFVGHWLACGLKLASDLVKMTEILRNSGLSRNFDWPN